MTVRLLSMLAATAVIGCKTVATCTLKTTGAIAEMTIKVVGAVTKTAINTTTAVSKKVPWEKGLGMSKIETAGRVAEVIRGSQKIQTTAETILKPGDVVRTPIGDEG